MNLNRMTILESRDLYLENRSGSASGKADRKDIVSRKIESINSIFAYSGQSADFGKTYNARMEALDRFRGTANRQGLLPRGIGLILCKDGLAKLAKKSSPEYSSFERQYQKYLVKKEKERKSWKI